MPEYKSSVLTCNICEDGCAVCEFLNGKRDSDTMLEVIRILDHELNESQRAFRSLSAAFATSSKIAMDLN